MAHAKLNLVRMLSWIEQRLDTGHATPTDAEICELFGFDSTESARTLLAELADAGKITIKGYGPDRRIALGRSKGAIAGVGRVAPAVKKADADVDRTAARLAEIVRRGRKPAAAVVAENAAALLKTVNPKPARSKPEAPMPKEVPMPAKTIQLPASASRAIEAIEAHAKHNDVSLGAAAAHLVDRAMATPAAAPLNPTPATIDDLCEQLRELFATRDQDAVDAAVKRAEIAENRATVAEHKLAQAKALFA
jgi:hypothetical protein